MILRAGKAPVLTSVSCLSALKWYRANCNIQAEIEEMQEEQRSLSTLETLSVWKLVRDDAVRWQVLSVAVINVGMQLSSIDAVSSPVVSLWSKRNNPARVDSLSFAT